MEREDDKAIETKDAMLASEYLQEFKKKERITNDSTDFVILQPNRQAQHSALRETSQDNPSRRQKSGFLFDDILDLRAGICEACDVSDRSILPGPSRRKSISQKRIPPCGELSFTWSSCNRNVNIDHGCVGQDELDVRQGGSSRAQKLKVSKARDWMTERLENHPLQVLRNRLPSRSAVSESVKEDDCRRVLSGSGERSLLERGSLHPRRLALERLGVIDCNVSCHA